MWLCNPVVSEDISPLHPPLRYTLTHTHTETHKYSNHDLVADGFTFFRVVLISGTFCAVLIGAAGLQTTGRVQQNISMSY